MDDGRLGGEMTLADIAKQLRAIQSGLDEVRSTMKQGFRRVDEALNAAKVRDEEILGIAKLGLEAVEALDEKVDRGFTRARAASRSSRSSARSSCPPARPSAC